MSPLLTSKLLWALATSRRTLCARLAPTGCLTPTPAGYQGTPSAAPVIRSHKCSRAPITFGQAPLVFPRVQRLAEAPEPHKSGSRILHNRLMSAASELTASLLRSNG